MVEADKPGVAAARGRVLELVAVSGALVLFLAVGLTGLYRYIDSYWLYRGFPPPHDPAFVRQFGTFQTIQVASAAIGGRTRRLLVYLPRDTARTPNGAIRCCTSCTASPVIPTASSARSVSGS